mmetsp:Transcript_3608/g.10462  ORF Transcript_3608/g.10462 Transcript_3608/m.10462 type:complete len:250 (-) Transcript_3608:97-846(-)
MLPPRGRHRRLHGRVVRAEGPARGAEVLGPAAAAGPGGLGPRLRPGRGGPAPGLLQAAGQDRARGRGDRGGLEANGGAARGRGAARAAPGGVPEERPAHALRRCRRGGRGEEGPAADPAAQPQGLGHRRREAIPDGGQGIDHRVLRLEQHPGAGVHRPGAAPLRAGAGEVREEAAGDGHGERGHRDGPGRGRGPARVLLDRHGSQGGLPAAPGHSARPGPGHAALPRADLGPGLGRGRPRPPREVRPHS